LLEKILWNHQNRQKIWNAIIGAFLGLFLLLSAIQIYFDIQSLTTGKGEDRYVLINKKVNIFNTLGASSGFTQEDLDTLNQQPFIESIGKFTPNQFKVSASSSMLGFYTELFFEAIEDEYLDIHPRKFQWKENQTEIPIIISRDYLALYNFGFAPSQGLPQFTQNTIKKVTIDINIRGRRGRKTFSGRIVGFSDRINSVLVPQSFMDWANGAYGGAKDGSISRLILATDNPYSTQLQSFLKNNGYEVSTGKLIGGQMGIIINIILGIIAFIGLIITVLSILVFVLNFELIISRASTEIKRLLELGYKTSQISNLLVNRLIKIFIGILVAAVLLLLVGHFFLSKWLLSQSFDVGASLHWSVYVISIGLALAFYMVNKSIIETRVKALFL
jgi:hypothetical protein